MSATFKHPVVMLEINEVPWRLVDRYREDPAFPNIRQFFQEAQSFTTRAVDTGELSPWVTWPTVHRGMNNEAHCIRNLGQDPATFRGTPIWEEFRKSGHSIGIFGAMQSWPPIDPGNGGFYVPDTFAHDSQCFPQSLAPLQAFNLGQVKKNPRVLSDASFGLAEGLKVAWSALSSGVRISTLFRVASQLLGERLDRSKIARRPVFQTILFWDVFCRQFDPANPPAYSSFFTNHIAGVMHRYWRDVFPEDFESDARSCSAHNLESHEPTMRFALGVLDEMLAKVHEWRRQNPRLIFVFASSMGQGPVYRNEHEGKEIIVSDLSALMGLVGLGQDDYKPLLAMVPQVAVEVPDASKRERALEKFANCKTILGESFIRVQAIGTTLSITVATTSRKAIEAGKFVIGREEFSWEAAGINAVDIDVGTGYHIPEGTLAFYGGDSSIV
ncbi:MAG: hypothetical protein ING62_02055, partial [Rhodocyclaceae bacterium]|nr:hypothetical protein [Rhodocyclaceae bacterium]